MSEFKDKPFDNGYGGVEAFFKGLDEGQKSSSVMKSTVNVKEVRISSGRIPIAQLHLSKKGEDFIKDFESIRYTPDRKRSLYYNDDAGFCTVGWGHLVKGKVSCASLGIKAKIDSISVNEAEEIFNKDKVNEGERHVKSAIKVPLFQHEFDALVSLAFNVGSISKIAPNLCRKINNKQYAAGSDEMLDIINSNGEPMKGLIIRRDREHKMFNNGVYDSRH